MLIFSIYFYRKLIETDKKHYDQEQRLALLTKQQSEYQKVTLKQLKDLTKQLSKYEATITNLRTSCEKLYQIAQVQQSKLNQFSTLEPAKPRVANSIPIPIHIEPPSPTKNETFDDVFSKSQTTHQLTSTYIS